MFSFSRCLPSAMRFTRHYHSFVKDISLVGVPFHGGQPKKGVDQAPLFLRKVGLLKRLSVLGAEIHDRGDVRAHNPREASRSGPLKNALACALNTKLVAEAVAQGAMDDKVCLTIGGDHSIAAGTIFGNASVRKELAVIWVDAHTDINTPMTTTSGNIHGMPVSQLIKGIGKDVTIDGFEWMSPCLDAKNLVYIGLRDVEDRERAICEQLGIKCYYIKDIDNLGIKEVVRQTMERINPEGDRPVHVSFDIDAVDPNYAPSTGTAVPDGLTIPESLYIANSVAASGCLTGLDIVEFNPRLGSEAEVQKTAEALIKITEAFFGKVYPVEPAQLNPQVASA